VADCREHCDGPSASVHGGRFVEHLRNCHLYKDCYSGARHVTIVVIGQ
jgi:hypothetical protein